ncbi:MAG: polynucleotide adenylyltransferase PcnB, partial [Deltaproteobacteria bacterium]|nr:polynucleotide adenylyltransferase PcnB [Deltaproteobacteria bacterium]
MTQSLTPITVSRIDAEAAKVVRRLSRHGHEAYLVGGCVRDLLVSQTPKDFDVATSATPEEIHRLFRNSRIIGRRFRLVHIFFGGNNIETATFRAAPRPAAGDDPLIWRDNEFGTAKEDALRRDFTINGLFYDVATGKVIDWVGGMADLRRGRVRTIGDPDLRMQEDPVRILRAAKFAARLGFAIDDATREAMYRHVGLLARCSVARVLEEIYKLLRGGAAALAFRELQRLGALDVLFPELGALFSEGTGRALPALRAG